LLWALPAIGALIWTVRRSGIFPAQLNDSELIRGSLAIYLKKGDILTISGLIASVK